MNEIDLTAHDFLISAKVEDSKALIKEAKELTEKYLKAGPKGRWLLSTPTYRGLYRLPDFVKACKAFGKVHLENIEDIHITSGVLVDATVIITVDGTIARFKMSLVKEKGMREPDLKAPLRVNAKTAPPFMFVNARE